jgi:alpha-N-arabinofuranosidase
LSIVNVNPDKNMEVPCTINGVTPKEISGKILTSRNMQDHNTFDNPNIVTEKEFHQFKIEGSKILVDMPSKSIVVLEIKK